MFSITKIDNYNVSFIAYYCQEFHHFSIGHSNEPLMSGLKERNLYGPSGLFAEHFGQPRLQAIATQSSGHDRPVRS